MAPGHRTSEAIGVAILIMLGVLVPVLGGIGAFIFHLARRSKQIAAAKASTLNQ